MIRKPALGSGVQDDRAGARWRVSRLLAVAALLVSVGIGVFSGAFNLRAVDVVAASRESAAGPGSWIGRPDEWQWDAITALGLAGALVAAYVVSACFHARRGPAIAAALAWALSAAGLSSFVWHASPNTGADLVLWQLLGGAALVAAVASIPTKR
jgi:hypothetical protein